MKRTRMAISLAALGALVAMGALGPFPQDDEGQGGERPRLDPFPPTVTIEFDGGTVRDYVGALRRASENVNIVLDVDAEDVAVPALALRRVMLTDALRILDDLKPENESFELEVGEYHSGPPELYAPVYRIVAKKYRPPQPPLQSSVWSVSNLIERGIAAQNILGAIETALSLQDDLGTPTIRFHEETGLILARAHPELIGMIAEVIHNLQSASAPPPQDGELEAMSMQLKQMHVELARAQEQWHTAESELRRAVRENEQLQARVEVLTEQLAQQRGGETGENSGGS